MNSELSKYSTPRPWMESHWDNDSNRVLGADGTVVAIFSNAWDGELCVRSANNFETLLKVCKDAQKCIELLLDQIEPGWQAECDGRPETLSKLEYAIQKAEELV